MKGNDQKDAPETFVCMHMDGRRCVLGPDGVWRHWYQDDGPLKPVQRKCDRDHGDEFGYPAVGSKYAPPINISNNTVFDAEPSISPQAERVCNIMDQAQALFKDKNRGYGDTSYALGARGQFADVWRKVGKLRHTLWDGNEAVGEDMEEMLMDLIGHCALTIDFLRMGDGS